MAKLAIVRDIETEIERVVPERSGQFQHDLVALIPNLRAFSRALCGKRALAEDMAQEALMKAWRSQASFQIGTNLKAWLFTILRNEFYSYARRARHETHWDADLGESIPAAPDEQEWAMNLTDMSRALAALPKSQREALILIAAGGLTYCDAAVFYGQPEGTVKSRVARARSGLLKILDGKKPLPQRIAATSKTAAEEILAQLAALTPVDPAKVAHL